MTQVHSAVGEENGAVDVLRRFIAGSSAAVAMFDRDLRYLDASERWLADHGITGPASRLRGSRHYDLFPEVPAEWRAAHARSLAGETVRWEGDPVRRGDDARHWVRWEVRPWHHASGAVGGIVISSERAPSGASPAGQLEALVDADRRKDEFLATVAHELRNPLAPIRTGVHLLRVAPPGSNRARHALATLERQVGHLVRLVDDLLDASRISRGSVALRRERLEVRTILEHGLEASLPAVELAGHELAVDLPAEALWVDGDLTRLAQVVANVVNNAAKFTPRGGRVAVSARRAADRVVIEVADNGVGVSPDVLPRVFEMFAQGAHGPTHGGLGIGLALVKGLVELHGGSVTVASRGAGAGATVVIDLPLAAE